MSSDKSYQVGGSLEYQHPTYVVRQADEQLSNGLKNGEFCYVLNSRQMGKSSLWVQTIEKLKAEGISCGVIDLTEIGTVDITAEKWYLGVIRRLVKDFDLSAKFNYRSWWKERDLLSPLQRFGDFIEDVLLVELSANMVIFIDEIDSILKIKFKDDFFAFIRACYNKRVNNVAYKRLTFCLLGVATPSDLIQDKQRTPFNIGCAVELTGFTFPEAKLSLKTGLKEKVDDAETVLKDILKWTGGQPFLTQKLCKLVVEKAENRKANVEELVQKYIIENWETQDEPEHLKTIRDRILKNEECAGRLLGLYQQILVSPQSNLTPPTPLPCEGRGENDSQGRGENYSQGRGENYSPLLAGEGLGERFLPSFLPDEAIELQLSGLVVKKNGKLQVYNQIYQQVFNRDWIEAELAKLRLYSEAITAWLASKREDTSRLLRGEALREALQWKMGKSLSVEDYDFLDASQQFALAESEQARQILEKANREAKQLIAEAKEGTKLERAGVKALQLFESKTGEIKALLAAMEAGQALQKLVRGRRLLDYPATSPLLALQQILLFIRERNRFRGHQDSVLSVCFSPDGKYLATASSDETAKLWDLAGNQIAEFTGHQSWVRSVCFSPDGKYLATASSDKTALLWDLAGHQIAEFTGHQDWVNSVCFSPDGKYLATASSDKTAKLWDLAGHQIAEFTGHQSLVLSVCFSPDGKYLATASGDKTAKLWDLAGNQIAEFTGHQSSVLSVCFSPEGKYLATASSDKTAKLWDLAGDQIADFTGHQDWVKSVCFSPDGKYLATASSDKTAKLWDLAGHQIAEFTGHQSLVLSVCFSPDGKYLATASGDKTAKLWDLAGNQIAEFTGHQTSVFSVCFSPDGKYLATASRDKTAKLWRVEGLEELLARGCEWLKFYLASHPEARERLQVCGDRRI